MSFRHNHHIFNLPPFFLKCRLISNTRLYHIEHSNIYTSYEKMKKLLSSAFEPTLFFTKKIPILFCIGKSL